MSEPLLIRVRSELAGGATLASALRTDRSVVADDVALADLSRDMAAELSGAGPLEPLLALPGVTDVLVNAPDEVWLDRGAGLERAPVRFADDAAVRRLAQRLAAAGGRRLDDAAPYADVTLPDGTRLHAVLPPLAACTTLSLRVLRRHRFVLASLVGPDVLPVLSAIVDARLALLISGGTGSGKTTLLGALLSRAAPAERLVTIEDARELVIEHPHVVRLAARGANVDGAGAVPLRELVRQAMRMRPDRIVVGEFRGDETVELLVALNTGHDGSAATVHANSALDVPARLVALAALGGLSRAATCELVSSALEVVVHLRRTPGGARSVAAVGLVRPGADRTSVSVQPAWTPSGPGPGAAGLARALDARDVPVPAVLCGRS